MDYAEWRDALDRALASSGSHVRSADIPHADLSAVFASQVSPVLAARSIIANPPAAPIVATPDPIGRRAVWAWASPRWLRAIALFLLAEVVVTGVFVGIALLICLFAPAFGKPEGRVALIVDIGVFPWLASLVSVALVAGAAQVLLAVAEAVEWMRRS